ncbi:MAG TPA: deoxyribonuclease V [Syntrophobacteraceae bacterium]|nr:deoxyribonuclease V [Syntrophobacteraceae bacterium]
MNHEPTWDLTPQEAKRLQEDLASQVCLRPLPTDFGLLGAADIGYVPSIRRLVAVMMTFLWPGLELVESSHVVCDISFPYIPGLLSFREIPPLLAAHSKLSHPPDVLLCDGHGIAHPRRLGLASHLGLCLRIPTVGVAKKRLCGTHGPLNLRRGNFTPLYLNGDVVGYVYCSRDNVKPLYLSPGHLADLNSSTHLVERCLGKYRIPEPLRQTHRVASELRLQYGGPDLP